MAIATRTATITDPVGIHARPASLFAQAAAESGRMVTIAKQPGTAEADASSIMSVMGLGIKQGDTVKVRVEGENADSVADALTATLTAGEGEGK